MRLASQTSPVPGVGLAPVLWLFTASGATSLIYEVLWRRTLMLVLGGATWATAITLSAFMAGLGIGAIVVGRAADRWKNPLRWYGLAEIAIGVYALIFPLIAGALRLAHDFAFPHFESIPALLRAGALVAAFVALLPPTLLMGGTFPLLVCHYMRWRPSLGRGVRDLYLFNTAGAVGGTLLCGFLLIRALGTQGAGIVAAVANLAIGAAALALSRGLTIPEDETTAPPPKKESDRKIAEPEAIPRDEEEPSPARIGLVLIVFALSGLTALSYETLWTRIMVFVVGNTTHSFAIMLSSFLCGLALGAWLLRFVGQDRAVAKAAVIEGLIALSAIGTLFVGDMLQSLRSFFDQRLGATNYISLTVSRYALAMLVVLPTATLFGLAYPLLVRASASQRTRTGSLVGRACGANTFGAILGPLAAMLLFIPLFGLGGGVVATAAVNLALSLVLASLVTSWSRTYRLAWAAGAAALLLAVAVAAPRQLGVGRYCKLTGGKASRVLYYKEDSAATVTVFEIGDDFAKLLCIDGVSQVPTDADAIQVFHLLGHLPFLVRDDVRDVLVTAFGGGITLGAILTHPVRSVEAVEICPGVLPAARLLRDENRASFEDPRLQVIIADANSYARATPRRYDAIVSDATHPGAAESWVLYTREFYQNCQRRLRPGGVMCQWVPLHGLSPDDLRTILRTFQSVYPHTTLWFSRGYAILLATEKSLALNSRRIAAALADPIVGPSLQAAYMENLMGILKNLALNEESVAYLAEVATPATENRSPLEFAEQHSCTHSTINLNCVLLAEASDGFVPVSPLSPDEQGRLRKTVAARPVYYRATGLWNENKLTAALPLFRQVAEAIPNDGDVRMYAACFIQQFRTAPPTLPSEAGLLDDLRALARSFSDDPIIQMEMAQTLLARSRNKQDSQLLAEGLGLLRNTAERFSGEVVVQNVAAEEFFAARQYAPAQLYFERVSRLLPDDPASWSNLAACLSVLGRHDEALKAVSRALSLQPDYGPALQVRATIEKQTGPPPATPVRTNPPSRDSSAATDKAAASRK